ncbi:MAG: biotin--[acetyl-CoA-carboxylase] ligase [Sandaracinaceae bacterium]|nr:biotin--[acetyl-CoA-carboxylase] ligase [Sandaracinaceae bacterium]
MIPEDLDPALVRACLRTARFGRSLDVRAETGSTNDDARAAAEAGAPDGHVVVADAQRRGRGAHGRPWSSPPGRDLYVSIVVRPPSFALPALAPLTLAVGLGLARAVAIFVSKERVRVKWPNDVLIDERKCAGILVETSSLGERAGPVVIGIGVDVGREQFDEDLAPLATSLRLAAGHALDRASVLAAVLSMVEAEVDRFFAGGLPEIVREIESILAMRGERVECGSARGELVGLAPSGALRLRVDGSEREIVSGSPKRLGPR